MRDRKDKMIIKWWLYIWNQNLLKKKINSNNIKMYWYKLNTGSYLKNIYGNKQARNIRTITNLFTTSRIKW